MMWTMWTMWTMWLIQLALSLHIHPRTTYRLYTSKLNPRTSLCVYMSLNRVSYDEVYFVN